MLAGRTVRHQAETPVGPVFSAVVPVKDRDGSLVVEPTPSHFDLDVAVTHVLIDRFLPFDSRVLIRVYASPTDGRSGGGYVQYTLEGTYVKVIQ